MDKDNMKMCVVCSSHMDREWYFSFEETRIYTDAVIDRVLDLMKCLPDYKFMMDGQTSVLEDYLEIQPEREPEIRKYISEGRLVVGPWFIQPDEYIPTGESLVRNLLLGFNISKKYGRPMHVGYVPDAFGHVSQLPQILSQFGIKSVFMSRGCPEGTPRDFLWKGIDGTEAVGVFLGYGGGNYLDPANMRKGIQSYKKPEDIANILNSFKQAAQNADLAPYALMMYGGDMMAPPKNFEELGIPSFCLLEDCMNESEKVKEKFPVLTGELRNSPDILGSLQDTLFSRIYLKQENQRAQNSLIRFAEPLCALAYGTEKTYPAGFLNKSWKYLLENHTHDGICGCSNNDVHSEMMTRFKKSRNISERWANIAFQRIADNMDTQFADSIISENVKVENVAVVFNPHTFGMSESAELEFVWPTGDAPAYFEIQDGEGRTVPYQLLNMHTREFIRSYFDSVQHFAKDNVYRIVLKTGDLPSFGVKAFNIIPKTEKTEDTQTTLKVLPEKGVMENDWLSLTVNENGTLDIYDKINSRKYSDMNYYKEDGDGGDTYKYVAIGGKIFDSRDLKWNIEFVEKGPLCAVCHLWTEWDLPERMVGRGAGRTEETVRNTIEYYVTMYEDSPIIRIKTNIDNQSCDHRIRAHFPTGLQSEHITADSPYSVETRKDIMLKGTQPMQSFCAVTENDSGFAVLGKGLHQYEYIPEENGTLALSLLRGQGVLYRWFFERYNEEFSECQCLGPQSMEYALCLFTANDGAVPDCIPKSAAMFGSGLLLAQTDNHDGCIPHTKSFISVENSCVHMASMKLSEDRTRILARFYNLSDKKIDANIKVSLPADDAVRMDLLENVTETLTVANNTICLSVKPHEIFTVGFGGKFSPILKTE